MGNVPALNADAILAATQTYALEGSAFVIMATQVMSDAGARVFPDAEGGPNPLYTGGGGYARVYGPHSGVISETLDPSTEGIVYADLDLAQIDLSKNIVDPAGHYARPDVTRLIFNDRPQRPVTRPSGPDVDEFIPEDESILGSETPTYA